MLVGSNPKDIPSMGVAYYPEPAKDQKRSGPDPWLPCHRIHNRRSREVAFGAT